MPRAEFASKLAKTICEASTPCCIGGTSYDEGVCQGEVLGKLGWKEDIEKSKTYEASHAAKCLEDARGLAAKCEGAKNDILRLPSCAAMLHGPRKTGESCDETEDCAPPAKGSAICWTGAMADQPGKCGVSLPPEKGAACFTPLAKKADPNLLSFSECNDDPTMTCDKATNKCGPRQKAGGACEQDYECEEGSVCAGGKCKAMLGASCKGPRECASKQACTNGKCTVGKKLGEKCAWLGECAEGMCGGTQVCVKWAAAFLCKAPGK